VPLFRQIGSWAMQRGVDGLTGVIVLSIFPVLPLILGIGLFYELFRRLDFRRALSERTYWALATVTTALVILLLAIILFAVG
jgi:hypothetical protein